MSRSACSTKWSSSSERRAGSTPPLRKPANSMAEIPPSPETRKSVDDRLRYYEDLGIHVFYRDRTSPMAKTLMAKKMTMQKPATPVPAARAALAEPAVAKGGQGIVQGPSLFEAADRIVG